MTLFWVMTLQWSGDGVVRAKTVSGRLLPDQVSSLKTRHAAFPVVLDAARHAVDASGRANPVVLFYSLEPDDLTTPGRAG